MKKILITGGLGFIGSVTCSLMLNKGFKIVLVDNQPKKNKRNLDNLLLLNTRTNGELFFLDVDLKKSDAIDQVFKKHKIDGVLHFAALKSVPESINYPLEYYSNNILGSLNLLEAMVKNNVKNIVFSSTAALYSVKNPCPIDEDSLIEPSTPYATSKFFVEKILKDFHESYLISSISLRYFNPIGTDSSNIFGDEFNKDNQSITSSIIKTILKKQKYLELYGKNYETTDGTALRDFIHVQDVAIAHVNALNLLFRTKKINEYINIGCGNGYTILELVKMFKDVSGYDFKYKFIEPRQNDIPISIADIGKAQEVLKWKPTLSLKQMCIDVLKQLEINGYR